LQPGGLTFDILNFECALRSERHQGAKVYVLVSNQFLQRIVKLYEIPAERGGRSI